MKAVLKALKLCTLFNFADNGLTVDFIQLNMCDMVPMEA